MKTNSKRSAAVSFTLFFSIFCILLALLSAILTAITIFVFSKFESISEKVESTLNASSNSTLPVVIIDAGHGGEDGGAIGNGGITEKELNLDIAKTLSDMLISSGIKVIMTRTEDILLYDRNADYKGHKKSLDLRARLEVAKSYPDSIFISIHMNAFPDERYSGLQVWYSKNNAQSKILADNIQGTVKNHLQPDNNRKTKAADSSIFLLNRAPSTAVLVECGFLSNQNECERLKSKEYRQSLALLIFSAITEYSLNSGCK